jgi:hypothetical protein
MSAPATRPPLPLVAAAVVFVGFLALLVAQSLAPQRIETFPLGAHAPRPLAPGRTDTLTIDVRDATTWRYVDLDRGVLLAAPDTLGWDIAARRFQLRVPGDAAARTTRATPPTAATPALDLPRWYRYDFLSHLLRPTGLTYQLRTDGGEVTLEVLGYYCPGPTAGCLTFRHTPVAARNSTAFPARPTF